MKNKAYDLYDVTPYTNLKELLEDCCLKYEDRIVFEYEERKKEIMVSYREFGNAVKYFSSWLKCEGYAGKNIALVAGNSYQWILSFFGVVTSGNVIVPIDRGLPLDDLEKQIIHSDSTAVICDPKCGKMFGELECFAERNEIRFISMEDIDRMLSQGKEYFEKGVSEELIDDGKTAAIIYTSGTTGDSKGVVLSHGNIAKDISWNLELIKIPEKALLVLPLHHIFGLSASVLAPVVSGSRIYINQSLKYINRDINKFKPQYIAVVPMIIEGFYKEINKNIKAQKKTILFKILMWGSNLLRKIGIDLRKVFFRQIHQGLGGNLELLISGGAALDEKYEKWFTDLGVKICVGYGITECAPIISVTRDRHCKYDSVGVVSNKIQVKIKNPDKKGRGHILVKGDIVFKEYYKDEEETKKAFEDGWFKTGDIGYMDTNGFLHITGRIKNLIILNNGKNVSPESIEKKIDVLSYVQEVVVYGKNNRIVAEVFMGEEHTKEQEKQLYADIKRLNRELPSYKYINDIIIRNNEFQKTSSMKIKRNFAVNS